MNPEKKLHFTDVGEGEVALVFLHYFGGSSNTWNKVIDELKSSFRCIAIDLPGFGDSQSELTAFSVGNCANEVAWIIKVLALRRYILAGHSMGGKIALALASMQPTGLTSVVLIAPSPPTPEPMDDDARKRLLKAYGDRAALNTLVNSITAQSLPQQDMEDAIADNLRASQASWNWWAERGSQEDISPQMSAVKVPVLVISGETDPNFSTSFLHKEMVKYFPSASFTEISNAGHLLPVEKPLAVAKLVKEFIDG